MAEWKSVKVCCCSIDRVPGSGLWNLARSILACRDRFKQIWPVRVLKKGTLCSSQFNWYSAKLCFLSQSLPFICCYGHRRAKGLRATFCHMGSCAVISCVYTMYTVHCVHCIYVFVWCGHIMCRKQNICVCSYDESVRKDQATERGPPCHGSDLKS